MKVIELTQLHYRWPKQKHDTLAIEHLRVEKGQHLFVRGASGSGKTTLLNLLTGILLPSSGQLNVLNQPLNQLNKAARDRFRVDHLGIIFQQFNLLPYLSMIENVQLPCHFSPRRRQQTGDLGKSTQDLLNALGLDKPLQQRPVTDLSVGQQQRVAVARALIGNPELIIADEPTSALDTDKRDDFLQLLFKQAQVRESTVILVSHDPHMAQYFPQVLDLQQANLALVKQDHNS